MEIWKCNKSIYVDHNLNLALDEFMTEILSKGKTLNRLYTGKDSFQEELYTWNLENMEWDRTQLVRKRFSAIAHSEIVQYLECVYIISKVDVERRRVERK